MGAYWDVKSNKNSEKRKLDVDLDDLENSMLVEEVVAKKSKVPENRKKRPLEDVNTVVPVNRTRGRPRKNAA